MSFILLHSSKTKGMWSVLAPGCPGGEMSNQVARPHRLKGGSRQALLLKLSLLKDFFVMSSGSACYSPYLWVSRQGPLSSHPQGSPYPSTCLVQSTSPEQTILSWALISSALSRSPLNKLVNISFCFYHFTNYFHSTSTGVGIITKCYR